MTDDEIITEAKKFLELCQNMDDGSRAEALEDLKFRKGDQWDEQSVRQRELDGRPCLTINNIPAIIHQVTNDVRQNQQSIHVHPSDSDATPEVAEIIEGLCRHIEYDSGADAAYDTAVDYAASIGFGYFRLVTEYCNPMSFDQDMKIKRVRNPFTVYMDPAAEEADGSDSRRAIISTRLPRDVFERDYPKKDPSKNYLQFGSGDNRNWVDDEFIRVAEYYRVEEKNETLARMSDGSTRLATDKAPLAPGVYPTGETRTTTTRKIMWYKITALEVLEKAEIPFDWIPIFPVYGDEIDIDGRTIRSGLIRYAKDPKRMENYWMPLCLGTPVPTPSGWSTIGALQPGDKVFSETGQVCDVVGKSPVYINRDCFRVEFDDGSHIIADAVHPWVVSERKGGKSSTRWEDRKLTTAEIIPGKHKIRCADPLAMPAAPLPVDPYLLGYWLGDGKSDAVSFTVDHADVAEVRASFNQRGFDVGPIHNASREGDACTFSIKGQMDAFRAAGVLNNKHIPAEYLRASPAQRWELLRGLMDTDGSISTRWQQCAFHNTNMRLVEGIVELLRSLGIKSGVVIREARVSKLANGHNIIGRHDCATVSFSAPTDPVFNLARKAVNQQRKRRDYSRRTKFWGIKAVTPVSSVPVQCIAVTSPSHLFLAGRAMIPTHNTAATEEIALRTKTPFIGAMGQFEGVEEEWNSANNRSYAYLEYNPVTIDGTMAPPPVRQAPADVPSGYITMGGLARDSVKAVTGIYDASLGNRSNETSGIAINARKHQGEIANFHFSDNLSRAIRHLGRTIVSGVAKVYDTQRIVRIVKPDGTHKNVEVNKPEKVVDNEGTEFAQAVQKITNDLTVGKYDVIVTAGPAYNTLREEAAAAMIEIGGKWPKLMDIAGDKVVRALDWPGAEEIAERIEKTLPPGLIDNPDDQKDMIPGPNGQPIPKEQATQLMQQMQDTLEKMHAELESHEAGLEKAKIAAQASIDVALINAGAKQDQSELQGAISVLTRQLEAQLAHTGAVAAAADPMHPDAPAPIAQGLQQAPADAMAAEQSHQQALEQQAAQPEPEAGESASAPEQEPMQ